MEEIKTNDNSKTTFYTGRGFPGFRKIAGIVIIAAAIIGLICTIGHVSSNARAAISHAKQIRVAMKLISMQYYNGDGSIFDPTSDNGLRSGALEKIENVCLVDGDIVLNSWDTDNDIPLSFTYREGRYLVEYREIGRGDGSYGMNGSWSVYYDLKILEYSSEQ